jgi:hypothetical protein
VQFGYSMHEWVFQRLQNSTSPKNGCYLRSLKNSRVHVYPNFTRNHSNYLLIIYIKMFETIVVLRTFHWQSFAGFVISQYYTSNSNCPIRKLSLCHVSMKLIAISRLTSSNSEPAFLLTMFHPMFPGEHGVEHYSRRTRATTRMTTRWPTKHK